MKLKIGDNLMCIKTYGRYYHKDDIYKVININSINDILLVQVFNNKDINCWFGLNVPNNEYDFSDFFIPYNIKVERKLKLNKINGL